MTRIMDRIGGRAPSLGSRLASRVRDRLGMKEPDVSDVLKGVAAGMIGGFIGALVADGLRAEMSEPVRRRRLSYAAETARPKAAHVPESQGWGARLWPRATPFAAEEEERRSEKAASVVAERLLRRRLAPSERAVGGDLVRAAFGACIGGVYGGLAEIRPEITAGLGAAYGVAIGAVTDEGVLPLLRLGKPPLRRPLGLHARMFACHTAYGVVLELVRRGVRTLV